MTAGAVKVFKVSLVLFIIMLSFPAPGQDINPDQTLQFAGLSSTDKSRGILKDIKPDVQKLSKGRFLVASNRLQDQILGRSVILLVAHDHNGSMGLLINKHTESKIADLLPDVKELAKAPDTLFFGGPVSLREVFLLVRTDEKPDESMNIIDNVYMSKSMALLKRMVYNKQPGEKFRLYAGYAGWGAGQLETEVIRGDWLVVPANAGMVFDEDPAGLWDKLKPKAISI